MPSLSDYLKPDLYTYKWRVYGDVELLFRGDIHQCAQYWLRGDSPIILPNHFRQQDTLLIGRLRIRVEFERGVVVDPRTLIPLFPTQDILTVEQLGKFLSTVPNRMAEIERRVQEGFSSLRG